MLCRFSHSCGVSTLGLNLSPQSRHSKPSNKSPTISLLPQSGKRTFHCLRFLLSRTTMGIFDLLMISLNFRPSLIRNMILTWGSSGTKVSDSHKQMAESQGKGLMIFVPHFEQVPTMISFSFGMPLRSVFAISIHLLRWLGERRGDVDLFHWRFLSPFLRPRCPMRYGSTVSTVTFFLLVVQATPEYWRCLI
jgi:hypothetical protein